METEEVREKVTNLGINIAHLGYMTKTTRSIEGGMALC